MVGNRGWRPREPSKEPTVLEGGVEATRGPIPTLTLTVTVSRRVCRCACRGPTLQVIQSENVFDEMTPVEQR